MVCFIGKTHHALIGIIFTSLSFLFVNSALFASYEPDCYSVERERNATIRILSLDGGAVRGIIPATILARLCQEAGLEVSDMFHVVGGSSAGGMIGTCLTIPKNPEDDRSEWMPLYTAQDCVDMFFTERENILKKRWFPIGSLYDVCCLEDLTMRLYGDTSFDQTLIPTAALTYDYIHAKAKVLKSWDKEVFYTRDAVLSTTAVPLCFHPRFLSPINAKTSSKAPTHLLGDGGILANDPTAYIIKAARDLYPHAKNFEVVSIGTGFIKESSISNLMRSALGIMGLNTQLADFYFRDQSKTVENYIDMLFPGHYTRLNFELPYAHASFNDTSESNVRYLHQAANHYVDTHPHLIRKLAERLKLSKDRV